MTTLTTNISLAENQRASSVSAIARIPTYVYASVFASLCIIVGLIWDISWHTSIGRDGLLSPPHISIYLGAVIAGIFSGFKVLKISFAGTEEEKASSISFWGVFKGSLGALFCIWGAIAMLTSAPFDDWWHNTYGLDVQILSPPHTVLALGMMMIQFGAMISALSMQNRVEEGTKVARNLKILFVVAAGLLLVSLYTIASEYLGRHDMHHSMYYQVAGFLFPLFLIAVAYSSKLKWAATATAAIYMVMMMLMVWILPLFPAEPLLGPIRNHVTNYQPFDFPMLLIFPAIAIDWLMIKLQGKNSWLKALIVGPVVVLIIFAVQWPFGDFLMSEYARNWFFGTESWYFGSSPDWQYRYDFMPWHMHTGMQIVQGIAIACGLAFLSSRLGMKWGSWMKNIKR
ncbi:MAG: hypothetical protein NXI20_01235 [bacterium]|nr:hypothetical protein [bacterium]